MNSSYEQKHPLYAASFTKRRKAMDLYEGGERIEENRAYLTRHTYESDKQYDIRASRATYRNFAAPIVDVFASFINEGRPERILPDALRPIEADADRYGITADAFFADVTRLAAAGGARFVIVDMEQKKGETVAEDRASGRRMVPYFTSISPDDVWDWGMDAKGLAWAVVHSEEMEHPAAFAAPLRYVINGMKTSGKKRDNLGSIGKSFRRGCNSIAESATKKEGNQPSFFVGG